MSPRAAIALAGLVAVSCGGEDDRAARDDAEQQAAATAGGAAPAPAGCPEQAPAPELLPGVDRAELSDAYWLATLDGGAADAVVLSPADITLLAGGATSPPLTRRAWLGAAFAQLGRPADGDPIGAMLRGLGLPADGAASFTVDLAAVTPASERLVLIDAAARAGLVVLHADGHRMIWLGRTQAGQPRVLHAPAHYLAACPDGRHTRMTVGQVIVSG